MSAERNMSDDRGFSTALEQFLVLSKTATGKAAAALIEQVLRHPNVFMFGELLRQENISKLAGTPSEPHLHLLKLFAHGTYQDYKANKSKFPPLNDLMLTKLKQLSIVSFVSERKEISYLELMRAVDVSNLRELEDMIINAIYQGLLRGKLDQKEGRLEVSYAVARDIGPNDVKEMMAKLSCWSENCSNAIKALDAKIELANRRKLTSHENERQLAQKTDELFSQAVSKVQEIGISEETNMHAKIGERMIF